MLCANVTEAINLSKKTVRFCTITLRATQATLVNQLQRLTESFKSLRRRKWWKETVVGGALFIEVKLGENSKAWHVHGHLLTEGSFIDQRTFAQEWHAVTGDSYIVDVRACPDPERRAMYVTKYATKPAHPSVLQSPDHLQEFVTAIKGKRLFQCFGTWKDFALDATEPQASNLTLIGSIENIFNNARSGDTDATRWMEAAVRKWPHLADTFAIPPPPRDIT
jgi:hypothetical protein